MAVDAGKIRFFCFDKTGTLTKAGLDFFGAAPISKGGDGGFANVCEQQ